MPTGFDHSCGLLKARENSIAISGLNGKEDNGSAILEYAKSLIFSRAIRASRLLKSA